jgi:leucyl aminopeptidase
LPSDIIHSYSGTSIEIIDTDAEGRLVLADGISYMIKKNQNILDIATLTGSSVGTLGYECALFTNNEALLKKLQDAGDSVGSLWQLPLWDVYKQDIESDIADVKIIAVSQLPGPLAQLNSRIF